MRKTVWLAIALIPLVGIFAIITAHAFEGKECTGRTKVECPGKVKVENTDRGCGRAESEQAEAKCTGNAEVENTDRGCGDAKKVQSEQGKDKCCEMAKNMPNEQRAIHSKVREDDEKTAQASEETSVTHTTAQEVNGNGRSWPMKIVFAVGHGIKAAASAVVGVFS